jgi:hypothetical protein
MWNYNGKVIREGRAWTDDDGTQHPANWNIWSADEKISKGLVWVDAQTQPDGRFYWFSQNADGTYTTTPRELEDRNEVDQNGDPIIDQRTGKQMVTLGLKSQAVAQTKQTQGYLLSQPPIGRIFERRIQALMSLRTYSNTVTRYVWQPG